MRIAKLSLFILASLPFISAQDAHAVEKVSGDTGQILGKKPTAAADIEIFKKEPDGNISLAVEEVTSGAEMPNQIQEPQALSTERQVIKSKLELLPKDEFIDFTKFIPQINPSTVKLNDLDLDGHNENDEPVNVNLVLLENNESKLNQSIQWFYVDRTNPAAPVEKEINLPLTIRLRDAYPGEVINAYVPNPLPSRVWTGEANELAGELQIRTQGLPFEGDSLISSPAYQF